MKMHKTAIAPVVFAALAFVAASSAAAVSAVSSNAISLDAGDWSKVAVASNGALPSFYSQKPATIILIH